MSWRRKDVIGNQTGGYLLHDRRHPVSPPFPSCRLGARVVMTRNIVELRQLSKRCTITVRLMETQWCHPNELPVNSSTVSGFRVSGWKTNLMGFTDARAHKSEEMKNESRSKTKEEKGKRKESGGGGDGGCWCRGSDSSYSLPPTSGQVAPTIRPAEWSTCARLIVAIRP